MKTKENIKEYVAVANSYMLVYRLYALCKEFIIPKFAPNGDKIPNVVLLEDNETGKIVSFDNLARWYIIRTDTSDYLISHSAYDQFFRVVYDLYHHNSRNNINYAFVQIKRVTTEYVYGYDVDKTRNYRIVKIANRFIDYDSKRDSGSNYKITGGHPFTHKGEATIVTIERAKPQTPGYW